MTADPNKAFEKVSVLTLRYVAGRPQLLTFLHPQAGRQIPAGSVDPGETTREAAERELAEETGVMSLNKLFELDQRIEELGNNAVALKDVRLKLAPTSQASDTSMTIKRGHRVEIKEAEGGWLRVKQVLFDLTQEPPIRLPGAEGWASAAAFCTKVRRTFFFAEAADTGHNRWDHAADGHLFQIEWVDLESDISLVEGQIEWLASHRFQLSEQVSHALSEM